MREGGRDADITALDRTLRVLGYEGETDAIMPEEREIVFRRRGLRYACLEALEAAGHPLTSREIAERVYVGKDAEYIAAATMRISKALKADRQCGNVGAQRCGKWRLLWTLR